MSSSPIFDFEIHTSTLTLEVPAGQAIFVHPVRSTYVDTVVAILAKA